MAGEGVQVEKVKLLQGDCLELMQEIPDESVDMVLSDPPYSAMIDAIQAAGWVYRGIVVLDKGNCRPIPNRFRNDCEYVVWGTNGPRKTEYVDGVFIGPGCYHVQSVPTKKKSHQTEKPVELLEKLLAICPDGGVVLDPFMGSGSTGVAAVNTGRNFIGMELDPGYFETACKRISEAEKVVLRKENESAAANGAL